MIIELGTEKRHINRDMIGLFFEDINFAADGGLYAQMLENAGFEAVKSKGSPRNYVIAEDCLYAWNAINETTGTLEISMNQAVSYANPHYLRFTAGSDGSGFFNKAYDGLALNKGMTYHISFYAREVDYADGDIVINLAKDGVSYGQAKLSFYSVAPCEDYNGMIGECEPKLWRRYETDIVANANVDGAVFEVILTKAGCVEFDVFSMLPEDAVCNVFRKDLLKALQDLQPGFLRFPGGCIVEGTSIRYRYQWKNTIGDIKDRKAIPNLWALQGGNTIYSWEMQDSHYMQSYGLGFYEYFVLCELLSSEKRRCQPLPVLGVGVACQFRSYETVPVNSVEFDEYVQDALDLIEFANGPIDSRWGAIRAKMGHPDSFNLEMIAIGNEQWESSQVDFFERYKAFEKAIHAVYPDIKCLGSAGAFVNNPLMDKAWDFYRGENAKNSEFAFAVDEHYYVSPKWLYDNVDFYNEYPRDISVFAGEYAAHDENLSNSMEAALAEAAMITGMERNGDVVRFASYAPLFNRIGHSHWTPDMIWFDERKVVLTPSYYVQKMFSNNAGSTAIKIDNLLELREQGLYVSAVKDDDIIIKIVNSSENNQMVEFNVENTTASVITLMPEGGKYVKVIATDREGVTDNRQLCENRAPQACDVLVETQDITNGLTIPARSFVCVRVS